MNKEWKDESFIDCPDYKKSKKVTHGTGMPIIISPDKLKVKCSVDKDGNVKIGFKR